MIDWRKADTNIVNDIFYIKLKKHAMNQQVIHAYLINSDIEFNGSAAVLNIINVDELIKCF